MERSSFAILFFVRDSRVKKDGTAIIEVALTVNGARSFFSTGKRVCVQNWDKSRQLVRGNSEETKSINKFLSALKAKIYQKEAELLDRGFVITAELLRDAYFDKVESLKEHSLMSVLEEHNAQSRSMVGKTVAKSTYFNFEHGGKLLQEYIRSKYGRNDLYLRELNLDFIQGFHAFLKRTSSPDVNSFSIQARNISYSLPALPLNQYHGIVRRSKYLQILLLQIPCFRAGISNHINLITIQQFVQFRIALDWYNFQRFFQIIGQVFAQFIVIAPRTALVLEI